MAKEYLEMQVKTLILRYGVMEASVRKDIFTKKGLSRWTQFTNVRGLCCPS